MKEQGNQQTAIYGKRVVRIIWWRTRALGFHQETTEEPRQQQDWFCITLYIILCQTSFILAVRF